MENATCINAGKEYSHGMTVCSNGKELVCNNGNWEPTGKDCDTIQNINDSLKEEETLTERIITNNS